MALTTTDARRKLATVETPAQKQTSQAPIPFQEMRAAARAIVNSGLFGLENEDEALSLMVLAQAEGMHYGAAVRDYRVIQGRPALKADAMLARFQQAGGRVEWLEYTDTVVKGKFSHPAGGTVTVDWTIERGRKAGLADKTNWKQYPRAMLRSRVISEAVRTVFPGVCAGVYSVEEVQDFQPPQTERAAVEVTVRQEPVVAVQELFPESELQDVLLAIREADDLNALKDIFSKAYVKAKKLKDPEAQRTLEAAKEAAKSRITADAGEVQA